MIHRVSIDSFTDLMRASRTHGQLVTVYQAAAAASVSRSYLYRLINDGRLTRFSCWGVVMLAVPELKSVLTISELSRVEMSSSYYPPNGGSITEALTLE